MPTPDQVLADPLLDISRNPVERTAAKGLDISLPTANTRAPVPDDIAQIRAQKYDLALGQSSPGAERIRSMILSPGGEDSLRSMAVTQEQSDRKAASISVFKEAGPTVDALTLDHVAQAGARPVEPLTAMEGRFAEAALATSIAQTNNPSEVNAAHEFSPEASQAFWDGAKESIARNEGFLKLSQTADAEAKAQGWLGFSADFAKGFIPLYTTVNQSHNLLGKYMTSWLPGNNKAEQLNYLYSMNPEDSVKLANTIYDEMKQHSVLEAHQWAQDLVSYSNGGVDNVLSVLDVASVLPVGMAKKVVGKVVAGGLAAARVETRSSKALSEAGKAAIDLNRVPATVPHGEVTKSLETTLGALETKRTEMTAALKGKGPQQTLVIKSILGKMDKDIANLKVAQGELAANGADTARPLVERLRRTVAVVSDRHITVPEMLSGTGHVSEAARLKAMELVQEASPLSSKTMQREISELVANTPSMYDPVSRTIDATAFHRPRANDLANVLLGNQGWFVKAVRDVMNVSRVPQKAEQVGMDIAEASLLNQYPTVGKAALHVVERHSAENNPFTNTSYIEAVFGKTDGTLFETAKKALSTGKNRYGMDISERDIFQEGDGYAIRLRKDVDETHPRVRSAILELDNQSNTDRNKIFGFIPLPKSIVGAKDSVSKLQAGERATATHALQARQALLSQTLNSVKDLSKKEVADLSEIMKLNRDTERIYGDPSTRGMFYGTTYELEQAYLKKFNRLPTDKEVAAYHSFVQSSDADYIFRANGAITLKARQGIERMELKVADGKSFSTEGKVIDYVPYTSREPASVYYAPTQKTTKGRVLRTNEILEADQRAINKRIKDGTLQVIHVYNPEDAALREGLGVSGPVNYIVVSDFSRGALRFDEQLPYRPGFHVKYKDQYFVKQPQMIRDSTGRFVYSGDTVALGVSNTVKAEKEAQLLERARIAVQAKDDAALNQVIQDGLPLTVGEIKNLFKGKFNLDTPFGVVKSGQNTADPSVRLSNGKSLQEHFGNKFDDFSNSSHNLNKTMNEFLGEKDGPLWSIKNSGTEDKPVWSMTEARTVDPMDTQVQAMGKLIRSKHFNDYQLGAAEQFVEEFGVKKGLIHLGGRPVLAEDLRRNPLNYLLHGTIEGSGAEAATARNIQRSIKNLVSHRSPLAESLANFHNKLLGSKRLNPSDKRVQAIDNVAAFFSQDLPSKLRAVAFHTKLGLGNPVQIMLQSQTLFNMSFIAPDHGPAATMASMWMRRLSLLPEDKAVVDAMAERMAKITPGWTAEHFLESYNLLKRSGFDLVGGDLSWKNDIADPKIFQGKAGKVLDWSAGFFNHTERFVRIAAWNTAYKRYLERFPRLAGKLSDADAKLILSDAQDLSGRMTRDSHAFWQEGALSTVTQFWGYSARMMDLLSGKALTAGEKARLVTGWSLLYGLPIGAGTAIPFFPYADWTRQMFLANGDAPDEGLADLINNGAVSTLVHITTGTSLDIGGRLGGGPIQVFSGLTQAKYGDTPLDGVSKIMMGASGSIALDIYRDALPIVGDLADIVSGTTKTPSILVEDVKDLASNISTLKQIDRAQMIWNTGMYVNKDNKTVETGLNPWQGIFHALSGLNTNDGNNIRAMLSLISNNQAAVSAIKTKAKEYIRIMLQKRADNNDPAAEDAKEKANTLLIGANLSPKAKEKFIQSILDEEPTLKKTLELFQKSGIGQ